ncbi:hypothetical protein GCM10011611_01800 [Aliidongia dinghuensis]|uniref:DUF1440 domain-containing protein n=1 Tax=Aliidongia dinghuensis TaxID=1867774 RepID=A0A8J3E098_9PROT|nr:hypothetical protein [Aliidongia dinghuensis]GGE99852.1 hypothetical protein GCM10011611_01800 [Aliidongia dinghuensis]
MARHRAWRAVVAGGLVAGLVDIGAAALINRTSPVIILRAIASGVLGRAAYHGGLPAALLGLGLQCLMSVLIAAIYRAAVTWSPMLHRRWVLGGLAAGPVIFAVMNGIVVPLSRAWPRPHYTPVTIVPNMAAMLLFGLIIAFFARRS